MKVVGNSIGDKPFLSMRKTNKLFPKNYCGILASSFDFDACSSSSQGKTHTHIYTHTLTHTTDFTSTGMVSFKPSSHLFMQNSY